MKKLITILSVLFLFSCNESVTISKEEYDKLKGDTIKPEYPKLVRITEYERDIKYEISLGSDGHEYMSNCISCNWKVLIHHPDCKKCKKDTL